MPTGSGVVRFFLRPRYKIERGTCIRSFFDSKLLHPLTTLAPVFKTLDRHILKEWLAMLGLIVGATFGMLLLMDMYGSFRDLLDYDATVFQIVFYYAVLAPSFISTVLPVSILISLLYTLGQLHRNNEFVAMRSAGLSVFRITRWIWITGLLLSGLLLYLNGSLIPWSVEQARRVKDNLEFAHEARVEKSQQVALVYDVAYDNQRDGRLWFIDRFSEYTYQAFGITVSVLDGQRREKERLMAETGYYDDVDHDWVLTDGRKLVFNPRTRELMQSKTFKKMIIGSSRDDPTLMLLLGKRPDDLSYFELKRILDNFTLAENPRLTAYAVQYHGLVAGALSCLIVVGLAIPFAVSGVRVNPAVGVSKSLGLFMGYYLLSSITTMIGERGIMNPVLVGWLPNIVMLLVALWFFRKVN